MSTTIMRGRSLAVIAIAGLLAGGCAAARNAGRGTENVAETTGRRANDASITFAVKSGIENEPAMKASKVDVATKDGVVTLTGTVPSRAASKEAERVAGRAEGVHSVINHLEVTSKP